MATAFKEMADYMTSEGWDAAVWSRSDAVMRIVTSIAVDDAFDIQRRRGVDKISRLVTAIP